MSWSAKTRSTFYLRVIENFRKKESEELIEILNRRDLDEWSEEAFAAAEVVLSERGDLTSFDRPDPTKVRTTVEVEPGDEFSPEHFLRPPDQSAGATPEDPERTESGLVTEDAPREQRHLDYAEETGTMSYDEFFKEDIGDTNEPLPDPPQPQMTEQHIESTHSQPREIEIFIAKREQRTGPFTVEQIEMMISSEMVDVSDMAWHSELTDWLPLHRVLGICPPVPQTEPSEVLPDAAKPKRKTVKAPKAKGVSDLLACVFFNVLLFLVVLMGVSGLTLAVRSLGSSIDPEMTIIIALILGVIFISLGYSVLIAYRHYHRRYLGRLPQEYKGAFGTKMKASEAVSGWLMVGGILVALISGFPFPVPFLDFVFILLATNLFVFSFDRNLQYKHLKKLRRQGQI